MNLKLTAPDKKVTVTKQELQVFQAFIAKQSINAFTGQYNFKNINRDREELYKLIISSFCEKLLNLLIKNYHQLSSKKIKIPVSVVEEKMLVNCALSRIQHKDDSPLVIAITEGILFQLKPIANA